MPVLLDGGARSVELRLVPAVGDAVGRFPQRDSAVFQKVRCTGVVASPQDQFPKLLDHSRGVFRGHRAQVVAARNDFLIEEVIIKIADHGDRESVGEFQQLVDLGRHPSSHEDDQVKEQKLLDSLGDSSIVQVVAFDPGQP